LVKRVKRRMCIRIVLLWASTKDVFAFAMSGLLSTETFLIPVHAAGL
jgi:hypothetical protein